MIVTQRSGWITVTLFVLALSLACNKKTTAPAPAPTVTNLADNFTYTGPSVDAKTATETYAWQNTGAQASVVQTGNVSAGYITLTLYDAAATQVYQRSVTETGTFATTTGSPGTWTIRVDFSHGTGIVKFHAQKA